MKPFRPLSALLLTLIALSLACQQAAAIAQMQATITPESDDLGTGSVIANLNFTEFTQTSRADNQLQFKFTNPEGDSLEFILSPKSQGSSVQASFPAGVYDLDGSQNTFIGSFTIVSGGAPETIAVTTTRGCIAIDEIFWAQDAIGSAVLDGLGGAYKMNFDQEGVGSGTFAWRANTFGATNCQ